MGTLGLKKLKWKEIDGLNSKLEMKETKELDE